MVRSRRSLIMEFPGALLFGIGLLLHVGMLRASPSVC